MLRLSVPPGDRLEDASAYDVHVAGSEANVAYAAARVGLRSAWASVLPDNVLGRRVANTLEAGGVDTALVRWDTTGRLGLYFVELAVAPRPIDVLYDRGNSAMALAQADSFDLDQIADARFVHISGITLALSDSCREIARRAAEAARARSASVTLDVNYRHRLWGRQAAANAVRDIASLVDVVVCTAEDARDLFHATSVEELQTELGVKTAVMTLGVDGAVAAHDDSTFRRPAHAVTTIDRVGAGDAFMAGLIWGLADGSLELGLERGLAMSALKMTLRGDLFRFDAAAVKSLLAGGSREVGR